MSRSLFVLLLLGGVSLRAAAPPVSSTPGAMRLGSDRLRIGDDEFVVAPNGRVLASAEVGGVCLWDLPAGKVRRRFEYAEYASGMPHAFCPESRWLALSLNGGRDEPGHPSSFGLLDVQTGKRLSLLDHDRAMFVWKVAFLNRGRAVCCLATRSCEPSVSDSGLHVWAVPSGKELVQIRAATCFATTPRGDILVIGYNNGWIRFYDASTLNRTGSIWAHTSPIGKLAISPDGRLLASSCREGGTPVEKFLTRTEGVAIWDVASRKRLRVMKEVDKSFDLQFVTNEALYGVRGSLLSVHDARTGLAIASTPIKPSWFAMPALSADKTEVAYVRPDGRVEVRRVDGKGPRLILLNTPPAVREVAFANGGRSIVVRGAAADLAPTSRADSGEIWKGCGTWCGVWDRATGVDSHDGAGHRGKIIRVAYSRDGKTLASLDEAGELRLTRFPGGTPHPSFVPRSAGWVMQFQVTPDGEQLCAIGDDGRAAFWDMASGRRGRSIDLIGGSLRESLEKRRSPFWCAIDDSPLGTNLVIERTCHIAVVRASGRSLEVVRLDSGKRRRLPLGSERDYSLPSFAVSDGGRYVAASRGKRFELWDLSSDKRILEADDGGGSFAFSADGRYFAWGDKNEVRLFDLPKRREAGRLQFDTVGFSPEGRLEFDTMGFSPVALSFDADGRTLAAYDAFRIVYWDVATKRQHRSGWIRRNAERLLFPQASGAVLSPESYLDENWTGRNHDLATGMGMLPPIEAPKGSHDPLVAVTPDGRVIAVGGRVVTLLERDTGKVIGRLPRYHRGLISAMAFSPDGRSLTTGGTDAAVFVWDWERFRDSAKK